MPPPSGPARDRPRTNNPSTLSPAAAALAWDEHAAGNEAEIAAHFPVPRAEVADRLLGLLLPCGLNQSKDESAA